MAEHLDTHDPIVAHPWCWTCKQGLSAAFARLAERKLGPNNADALIREIRYEARRAIAQGVPA